MSQINYVYPWSMNSSLLLCIYEPLNGGYFAHRAVIYLNVLWQNRRVQTRKYYFEK